MRKDRNNPLNTVPDKVPMMDMGPEEFKQEAKNLQNQFNTLQDELQVKLKLAQMEGADKLTELGERLNQLNDKLRHEAMPLKQEKDHLEVKGHLALMELKDQWQVFKKEALAELDKIKKL